MERRNLDFNLLLNWIGTFFIGLIVIILIVKGVKYQYYVSYLFISITSSFLGITFENIMYQFENAGNYKMMNFMFAIHITFFCFYLFFMFMFLDSLVRVTPSIVSLVFVSSLVSIMFIGVWLHFFYYPTVSYTDDTIVVTMARLAYDILGFYVFGIQGVIIYMQIFKKTKESLAFVFMGTQFFMMLGFIPRIYREIWNLVFFLPSKNISHLDLTGLSPVMLICNLLALVSIITFLILYIINIKYIIRLPHDIYFLGIYTLSGLKIYKASFRTSKEKIIQDSILSGIFSAFHSIFKSLFQSEHPIKMIHSDDFSLLFFTDNSIMVVVATEQPTLILANAMKQFLIQFNQEFPYIYKDNFLNLDGIENTQQLLKLRFPFLKIIKD
ncbi:hypothetical protein [Candidatus Harpocratesius sp.]